ncbi:MAG TPA: hypothetical protein VK954_06685 [Methyloradius sp.]|nr:hypothetical protein [Methyloradius sp.]
MRKIKGQEVHRDSGRLLHFEGEYEFKSFGIAYRGDLIIEEGRIKYVSGGIPWGLKAFPPKYQVEKSMRLVLQLTDIDKLLALLSESNIEG